ncbi:MAG TPA: hypothetical protein VFZ61_16330 [Polyangiales bacterium]
MFSPRVSVQHSAASQSVGPRASRPSAWLPQALICLALLVTACAAPARKVTALRFSVRQGETQNEFFRDGPAAAHLVLTAGSSPRLLVAFPAGNSGAALWFDPVPGLRWPSGLTLRAAHHAEGQDRWHGVSAELSVAAPELRVGQALLGSVRAIRGFEQTRVLASELTTLPRVSGSQVVWRRRRLDGASGYLLSIHVLDGGEVITDSSSSSAVRLKASKQGRLRLRVTALTGDPPLTPLEAVDLLQARPAQDARLRQVLAFLSYREKLLAGSWRFNSYFGRDTLMTLLLLGAVARPALLEAGLGAVFERLSASGEVAHEEEIGEYAIQQRARSGAAASDAPLLDYKMVDDDFMLAPAAAAYLERSAPAAARAFLARTASSQHPYGALLVRNLRFVVSQAQAFARDPQFRHLISLKAGERTGNWRDSEDGLAGGRYPYDVNAVLVPAALAAVAQLSGSGALQPYLDASTRQLLAPAADMAMAWSRRAPALFEVQLQAAEARASVEAYAQGLGLRAEPALAALGDRPQRFAAVALDERGEPLPILSSDESFALLLLAPPSQEVERIARTLTRPFPAGLMTGVGLVVANAAYAPPELAPRFDHNRYHGAVVWAWQQGLLAAGVERQLLRADLTPSARAALTHARELLRASAAAAASQRGAELWSWSYENDRYRVAPFGQLEGHETESNAAQLWSTIELAR